MPASGPRSFSFEVLPVNAKETVRELMPFKPAWINVVSRGRADLELCRDIQDEFGVEVVAHILCFDFDRAQTEKALRRLHEYGVKSVFALQGDGAGVAPRGEGFNHYAADLVAQIKRMGLDFRVGVAGYPEGHVRASSPESDIAHLKAKVDAGADYVITQMFFDNERFYDFEQRCRRAGIGVPIVPGLKVLSSAAQVKFVQDNFHVEVPKELSDIIGKGHEPAGAKWVEQQVETLLPVYKNIHLFVLGDILPLKKLITSVVKTHDKDHDVECSCHKLQPK